MTSQEFLAWLKKYIKQLKRSDERKEIKEKLKNDYYLNNKEE